MSNMKQGVWALLVVYAIGVCALANAVGELAGHGWGSVVFGLGALFAAAVAGAIMFVKWLWS